MGQNPRLLLQLSFAICLILHVHGQNEGSICDVVQYVDFIPECMFGCFCVSRAGVSRIECRDEPTSCSVSNRCSDPEIKPGCKCPSCLQGRHCVTVDENQETVKVPEGATNVPVGCAFCSCLNVPTTTIFVNIIDNKIDIGNLETREAVCDYQSCPNFNNGLDGEDGEDATFFGGRGRDGRDGANGANGFDVNFIRFANCAGVGQAMKRDSETDMLPCDFGCFCMLDSGRTVCLLPPACRISNRCPNPVGDQCGCQTCPANRIGSCVAEGPDGELVTIDDAGTTLVGGCAVCRCEAPETVDHHLYWQQNSRRPHLPQRRAICDTSACAPKIPCSDTDPAFVVPSSSDIPPCTFGCFCFTDGSPTLCVNPPSCSVTNRCIRPESTCGCPICPEVGNCIASFGESSHYLIADDGPKNLGPGGCAVCQCDPVSDPIQFPEFWLQGNAPPVVPQRKAVCDTKACDSGGSDGGSMGGSMGGSSSSMGGSGGSTGGSGGSMSGSGGSTGGSGGSMSGSGGSMSGSGGSTGGSGGSSQCDNKQCFMTNKCRHPELDECGCPGVCNIGNCIALSVSGSRYTIKERRYEVVENCAVCRCLHNIVKVEYKNYRISGTPWPQLPERMASCDYTHC